MPAFDVGVGIGLPQSDFQSALERRFVRVPGPSTDGWHLCAHNLTGVVKSHASKIGDALGELKGLEPRENLSHLSKNLPFLLKSHCIEGSIQGTAWHQLLQNPALLGIAGGTAPAIHPRDNGWVQPAQRGGSERDDGDFVLDAVGHAHAFGIRICEAHNELLGAIWDGYASRLVARGSASGCIAGGHRRVKCDAVDKVVVLERALGVVLDGNDLWLVLMTFTSARLPARTLATIS
jgi:hypothetical protein